MYIAWTHRQAIIFPCYFTTYHFYRKIKISNLQNYLWKQNIIDQSPEKGSQSGFQTYTCTIVTTESIKKKEIDKVKVSLWVLQEIRESRISPSLILFQIK